MTPEVNTRRQTSFWIAATVVVLFLGVGLRYPWPADEPRFAQIAREMVESGQWLFPTRGG
jgi:4-amino-4-deoxy-L-arabinose transferase-like glycosyltransferase